MWVFCYAAIHQVIKQIAEFVLRVITIVWNSRPKSIKKNLKQLLF